MTEDRKIKRNGNPLFVLVTGATGQQGGTVARTLLERGHRVRAFTRNADSERAKELKNLGAELFTGNFDDPVSLGLAMEDVDAVFAMGTPFEKGMDAETKQGNTIADAAKTAGIKHLIYTSVGSAHLKTGIPHFESKFKVEEHIRELGIPHTIIRPVYFMENLFAPWTLPGLKEGRIATAMPSDRKLAMISFRDIGRFAVHILENREEFLGRAIDIAGDNLTGEESAEILSRITGHEIKYISLTYEDIKAFGEDMITMYKWFNDVGYQINIGELWVKYPHIGWTTFEEWVKRQDWSILEKDIPQIQS